MFFFSTDNSPKVSYPTIQYNWFQILTMNNYSAYHTLSKITDSLYLTSANGAKSQTALHAKGITCVICVTLSVQCPTPNYRDSSIEFIRIPVDDIPQAQLSLHFDRVADKIHEVRKKGGRTVVHCFAGRSRSATLCIVYLMKYDKMTLKQAHSYVRSRRSLIRPNPGFWRQMVIYEQNLFGKKSIKMVSSPIGWIPDIYEKELKNFVPL